MYIAANISETSLVLDNDVFTHLRNDESPPYARQAVRECIRHFRPPALTSITIFEALYGTEIQASLGKLTEEEAQTYRKSVEEVSRAYEILNFDKRSAQIAAYSYPRVFAHIENLPGLTKKARKEKLLKIWKDVLVAATALAHGYGVATGNQVQTQFVHHLLSNLFL